MSAETVNVLSLACLSLSLSLSGDLSQEEQTLGTHGSKEKEVHAKLG